MRALSAPRLGLAGLVAALAVSLATGMPAHAAPVAPVSPTAPAVASVQTAAAKAKYKTHKVTISDARHNDFKLAQKAMKHVNNKGRLNWKAVKKDFGKHSTLRDGFGAGWWANKGNWSQFFNISYSDKQKIIAYAVTHPGPNPTSATSLSFLKKASAASEALKPKPCKGVTKDANEAGWLGVYYMDSCATAKIKVVLDICMPAAALLSAVGAAFKATAFVVGMAVLLFGCTGSRAWIGYASSQSTIDAVKIYYGNTKENKNHTWYAQVKIVPQ